MIKENLLSVVYGDDDINNEATENNNEVSEDTKKYCVDCGELIEDDNYYTLPNGDIICEDCYIDNYFTCEKCNEIHRIDECISINDDCYFVCEDCAEKYYFKCMDCGRWFTEDHGYTDNIHNFLCTECVENYICCDTCGVFVHHDDVCCYDDYYYCEDCYNEIDKTIYSYHSFNDWEYKSIESETHISDTKLVYYGFEIEVAGNRDCAERTQELLNDNAVLMYDGSVDGFEIVTHPMTSNYFYNEFLTPLNNTMNYLKDNNFKGHDAGGIHIHVSKSAFNNYDNNISNLQTILSKTNQDYWVAITQRKQDNLEHWAELYPTDSFTRYQAINEDIRTNTVEFRIFNSSLRIDRIIKNFQVVISLIDYVNENYSQGYYNDINNYTNYVFSNRFKYMNLYNFMIEKQIIKMEDLLQCA